MLKVRPMQVSDIDRVYTIELAAHRAPWSRDILRDCVLVGYNCQVLELHESAAQVVAYIICRHSYGVCHILNLCVDNSQQGKGYGRFLLEKLLNSLNQSMTTTVMLEVRPSNKIAIALYESLGFKIDTVKKGYYRDENGAEEDALLLKKQLNPEGSCP
ncbi:GCN5-related N-acetyltransferase [Legionella rubrilucens]|uniref:GCN5-related N-acetyltransferase n=1 Tax=Legionella rubrilucens TaxID=458 RepID=A0A0W0XWG1_9GAMM|nr:ribosomal protein S18-alanine N-acetyltransferase [Legionella rubrilucens]KTD49004.1 GCN5-related N-acetyltransferase [Legionella rubrilucens]